MLDPQHEIHFRGDKSTFKRLPTDFKKIKGRSTSSSSNVNIRYLN